MMTNENIPEPTEAEAIQDEQDMEAWVLDSECERCEREAGK